MLSRVIWVFGLVEVSKVSKAVTEFSFDFSFLFGRVVGSYEENIPLSRGSETFFTCCML